ncbi:lysophospholipase-like protein 1 [Cydia fagiglandana]|uniref:lysophospholipase-like protein 1 n=1 Tax=Cydia fagiglandana TaxID=1458189 RepID=UPI002FEDEC99
MSRLGALHLTKPTGPKHTATVIFFHGSGDTGGNMKEWVNIMARNFTFPHIKVMFPTAPLQPYTPNGGAMSNVWFDRANISIDAPEKLDSISKIEVEVKDLIQGENKLGIPSNRIIIGGFSMGGSLSFHAAYRWDRNIAGAFVFSSFLNNGSVVYQELKNASSSTLPPLLQCHGDNDDVVPMEWGKTTYNELKTLGAPIQFHVLERLGHQINKRGLNLIRDFIEKHLPDV